jgi:Zn-dependent membrane protease YugP
MPFFLYDPTMLLLIPAMFLAVWAQLKVKSTFQKYSRVPSQAGLSSMAVAKQLLQESGLQNVSVEQIDGRLTDHYDPRTRTLRLSSSTSNSRSVAAIGVAAHEVGHAIQHQKAYGAFQIRQNIFPVVNIGSSLAFPLFFLGFLFTVPGLMNIGIVLFSGAVLFHLVTLPVEYNASSRALVLLQSRGYLNAHEISQAKKVLNAAALTYVAATAVSVIYLLRLLLLRNLRD